jgi:hypothetical protein
MQNRFIAGHGLTAVTGLTELARLLKLTGFAPLIVSTKPSFRLTARYSRFTGSVTLNLKPLL